MRDRRPHTISVVSLCSLLLACSSSKNAGGGGGMDSGASGDDASDSVADSGGLSSTDDASPIDGSGAAVCPGYSGTLDDYSANLSKTGSSGQIRFVLVDAKPAPPWKGNNTWTLKLFDSSGAPIQNATFKIKTWMPQMHHGSSVLPMQAANADGTYSISSLYLIMAGIWQVTFTAQAGPLSDTAMYTFCVGG